MALLPDLAGELGRRVPAGVALVEYGASLEDKAQILLNRLDRPAAYVPIDIAEAALDGIVQRMRAGAVTVHPVAADFLAPLRLPEVVRRQPKLGFFPGSTIGNLDPATAVRFLRQVRATLGDGALFLVGADLRKEPAVLIPAYDDAAGVTAAFNTNVLARLNREAQADFDLASFIHEARWNDADSRIEMHLVSTRAQTVRIAGRDIRFARHESIHTENSYKHTLDGLRTLANEAGWQTLRQWTDSRQLFSVSLLQAPDGQ
jgi:dimethylhistidine N-methyltransferase